MHSLLFKRNSRGRRERVNGRNYVQGVSSSTHTLGPVGENTLKHTFHTSFYLLHVHTLTMSNGGHAWILTEANVNSNTYTYI